MHTIPSGSEWLIFELGGVNVFNGSRNIRTTVLAASATIRPGRSRPIRGVDSYMDKIGLSGEALGVDDRSHAPHRHKLCAARRLPFG